MTSMGSGVPLLNAYKQPFFWKRVPQTLLGGPKLRIGYSAPAYVYINQVIIFLIPLLFGGIFTSLVEYNLLDYVIGIVIVGCLVMCFVLAVQLISWYTSSKSSRIGDVGAHERMQNVLSEDDELLFETCCGLETVQFVAPVKKYKINIFIHAVLSGIMWGLSFWSLLPNTLNTVFSNNTAAVIIICFLSWITVAIAQYSLTVAPPPEPATWNTTDRFEMSALSRPFYVLLFAIFHVVARYVTGLTAVEQALYIVFILLPVLWLFGVLPPVDAFCLWLLEQVLVLLLGGSPMATDSRLGLMFLASSCVVVLLSVIPAGIGTVAVAASLGYILSTDLGGLGAQIFKACCQRNKDEEDQSTVHLPHGFLWAWGVKEFIFHLVMLALATGVSVGLYYANSLSSVDLSSVGTYFGYIIIGLLVLELLLMEIQQVYVLAGLWRNRLYPPSAQRTSHFLKRKRILNVFGLIRRAVMDVVAPLFMLMYLSVSVTWSTSDTFSLVRDMVAISRAYRWVWQSTQRSLVEVSVAHILTVALPATNSWITLGLGLQLLLLGICQDRLLQLINKLYLVLVMLIKSWADKKQRQWWTVPVIVVNLVLFPVMLGVVGAAAALAAPLLPLFTMPLFLIGYPRPNRFWPASVGASANVCMDTMFYKHITPQLTLALRTAFANGSIGEPSPGRYFLIRCQDRMAFVSVLETGYRFCTLSVKGLELQETSCHTVEAMLLDDLMELTFEMEKVGCCTFNKYPMNTLRPYDAAVVKSYSDAKNVLTGVIDSPEALQMMKSSFPKTLTWVLLQHIKKSGKRNSSSKTVNNIATTDRPNTPGSQYEILIDNNTKNDNQVVAVGDSTAVLRPSTAQSIGRVSRARSPSIKSFSDSIWSELDMELSQTIDKNKPNKPILSNVTSRHMAEDKSNASASTRDFSSQRTTTTALPGTPTREPESINLQDFGLPAVDTSKLNSTSHNQNFTNKKHNGDVVLSADFKSPHSQHLAVPVNWRDLPLDVGKLNSMQNQFDVIWFKHVLSNMNGISPEDIDSVINDDVLLQMYRSLVLSLNAIVNSLGLGGSDVVAAGPGHVYRVYTGDIPWSLSLDWLTDRPQLFDLTLRAYRYCVKFAIDQLLLGEADSPEEVQEYLQDYDDNWYIGSERETLWVDAISAGKAQLFSLDHDTIKSTYNSRTLTCQDLTVYISSVNSEAVRAQWANLGLELLYMTNDDEERYSIQAHSTILRNLMVQAADPPLGYPVFASTPLSVPLL